jgi:F-type H+-transporting ATPase subunit alpha
MEMAQFRELAAFAQFGSDLDESTLQRLERGRRLTEILKQPQYEPVAVEEQVMMIYAGTRGYCDSVPVDSMRQYEMDLLTFMRAQHSGVGADIVAQGEITDEIEKKLRAALEAFNQTWVAPSKTEAEMSSGDSA